MIHQRPFLRWAGSKRQLLDRLAANWPGGETRYIEPFAGSAALFFRVQPHSAILADLNSELINALTVLRDEVEPFLDVLRGWSESRVEYLRIRAWSPEAVDHVGRAARFVFLNRLCFNGLYRTNKKGIFNVPYGGDKSGAIPSDEEFLRCSMLLQSAELIASDFETVVERAVRGDFVYLDPPYSVVGRRVFREYGPDDFGESDVHRLRRALDALADRGVTFLVSYADSGAGRRLSDGYHCRRIQVRRNIAGFAGDRRRAVELLFSNAPVRVD